MLLLLLLLFFFFEDGVPKASSSSSFGGVSYPSPTSIVLPTVETLTGEEGERHVTQVLEYSSSCGGCGHLSLLFIFFFYCRYRVVCMCLSLLAAIGKRGGEGNYV